MNTRQMVFTLALSAAAMSAYSLPYIGPREWNDDPWRLRNNKKSRKKRNK